MGEGYILEHFPKGDKLCEMLNIKTTVDFNVGYPGITLEPFCHRVVLFLR